MLINRIELLDPVNLFLGAGISKQAPAYAPIWREMQIGFCEALFARMKSEKWDVADTETEIGELRRFNFRPETFWERVLNHTSLEFISSALQIVNRGQPNLNHKVIAELCRQTIVNNIITTNFDEYLDQCLPPHFCRVVLQGDVVSAEAKQIYFKIHGTIRSPESLQFTLQNTKKLPDWKSDLIERCLEGHALVIAGYSGWDDDIMPRLKEIAARIPKIIVLRYPGASKDEPVNSLGQFPQTEFIDTDFSKETQEWYNSRKNILKKHIEDPSSFFAKKVPDMKGFYGGVADMLAMPVIPYLVSLLFELAANRDFSKKYAWMADDACGDKRYQDQCI